ncbi:MAG: hypothetical protein QF450_01420 [Rhodospirillales bacterium]|jgi:hypothetical protein|nr:hypothetical protein [Rhodospirillales bacterium]HJO71925.1 hypothetical protein [Rhodospirillales bacterium]
MSAKATGREAINRESANREAFERLCAAEPVLVDVKPAIEALPSMTREIVLTSGAPLLWEDCTGGQRDALIGGGQIGAGSVWASMEYFEKAVGVWEAKYG